LKNAIDDVNGKVALLGPSDEEKEKERAAT